VEPGPCIDWVRRNCRHAVRGNHDHGAAQRVYLQGGAGFRYLTGVTRLLSIDQLSDADRRFLGELPTSLWLTINGKRFFLVHATPRDPMDEFAAPDAEAWKRRLEGIDADYVCVGHTHVPYTLPVGKTVVINPGSVGIPRDGDPRASYAVITDQGPELKRVEYPIHETIAAIEGTALPDPAKALLAEALRVGRLEKKNGNGQPNGLNGHVRGGLPL
jgi:putative phosphoesterase